MCDQGMLRPSEWGNDAVMAAMFASFEPRENAAAAYDQKMGFWTSAIRRRCKSKRSATFSVQRLANEFERNGQTPSCLSAVVDYMIRCDRSSEHGAHELDFRRVLSRPCNEMKRKQNSFGKLFFVSVLFRCADGNTVKVIDDSNLRHIL